jgi:hypothetical protein
LIRLPELFIHAGGLHGLAVSFTCGLMASARFSNGIFSALSSSIEKLASAESVSEPGMSS